MPHLFENNPLSQLRRLAHDMPTIAAGMLPHLDNLEREQETLKSAFKQKAREANLMKLRCIHWRERYEWSEQERHRLQRLLEQEHVAHVATDAALSAAKLALAREEFRDG